MELKKGTYKEVQARYERAYGKAVDEVYGNTEGIEANQRRDIWDMWSVGNRGNDVGNGKQTESEGLQTDTARDDEHLRNGDKGEFEKQKLDSSNNVQYADRGLNEHEVTSALWDALDHQDKGEDNLIKVGNMPKYFVNMFGIDGDFYIYRDHSYENMVSKEQAIEDGRQGLVDIINNAISENRVIDFADKKIREDLPVIAQQTRLGNITENSLKNNLTQFLKEVKVFREKNNITYSDRDTNAEAKTEKSTLCIILEK